MWFFSLFFPLAFAEVGRITATQSDLSRVDKIYISPGLVSLLEFPQNIIEVRIGNQKSVKAIISQVSPKELTVYLTGNSEAPSNLIVRSEKRIFVFDVVPSKGNHQDYVKIRGAFGAPNFKNSKISENKIEIAPTELKSKPSLKTIKSKTLKVGP